MFNSFCGLMSNDAYNTSVGVVKRLLLTCSLYVKCPCLTVWNYPSTNVFGYVQTVLWDFKKKKNFITESVLIRVILRSL